MRRKNLLHHIKNILSNEKTQDSENIVNQYFLETFESEDWDEERLGDKSERKSRILSGVESKINQRKVFDLKYLLRYAAVLFIVGFLGIGGWYLFDRNQDLAAETTYLTPGGDKAVLELGDGTRFDLSTLQEGETYEKSGFTVSRNTKGNLEYAYQQVSDNKGTKEWATLATPSGGQYSIVLEDGTKAWLNAGSTLSFPSSFAKEKRVVKANGEVYFQVSKEKDRPFIVQARGFDIQVLGTSFNLSAYEDRWNNSPTVALLEGSVEIKTPHAVSRLSPGEKATMYNENIAVTRFDAESEVAWKDNYFVFKDRNIKEIMSALARWYDAEVEYIGEDWKDKNYTIKMSRHKDVKDVLSIIELTKSVKFKIEERRITVYKITK